MKLGIRKVSISKTIKARTTLTRMAKNNLGIKAPSGHGSLINPKKALFNKVYSKTSFSIFNSKFWNWFK
ncbi:MAG: hypothetical protein RLY43_2172 [Bacteroidota bacterium]|jgi:hypothetical protein